MSVTISDMMQLPAFREAKVVAGRDGMSQVITSITVLELDDPKVLGFEAYGHTSRFGSEIVITAFIASRYDVDRQCETIRRLKGEGEIGIIIFYVGCILPRIDDQVIRLADELGMPLIIMPEGKIELRYSDVICDVMEAVVKDRQENVYFATELIERLSHTEVSARSISGVLALIRDRIHCSIFVLNEADEILNYAEWPKERNLPVGEIVKALNGIGNSNKIVKLSIGRGDFFVERSPILCEGTNLATIIIKEQDDLTMDCCNQINYVIKTYLNLWTTNYGRLNTKQLVSAIINDEPEKMGLIAEKLDINVKDLSYVYFLFSKDNTDHDYHHLKIARETVKDFVGVYRNSFLVDIFDETVVAFADGKKEIIDGDLPELLMELKVQGLDYYAAVIDTAMTTEEVKAFYWMLQQYKKYVPIIFCRKDIFTGGELSFIEKCKEKFDQGLSGNFIYRKIQQQSLPEKNEATLIETLEIFLLDGDRNILKTAELMDIHNNTAKYRIKSLENIFGHKLTRMPEVYDLYFDAAMNRLNRTLG